MIAFSCPVRACGELLQPEGPTLRCAHGHSFDRAREGYWNLTQPQDRRSAAAGDAASAVEARRRWLDGGFALGLSRTIRVVIDELPSNGDDVMLDVGCGEGTMTAGILAGAGREICGVDLSVAAIRLAARRLPDAVWIVANADRRIPLRDGSVDLVLSVFGRRNSSEFFRVLRPSGHCVVIVPGSDDLAELREAAQGSADSRDRVPGVLAELDGRFHLAGRLSWRDRADHDRDALADALAMSYRGARHTERTRIEGLTSLAITLSAEILVFERTGIAA